MLIEHTYPDIIEVKNKFINVLISIEIHYTPESLPDRNADNDIDYYGTSEEVHVDILSVTDVKGTMYPVDSFIERSALYEAHEYVDYMYKRESL